MPIAGRICGPFLPPAAIIAEHSLGNANVSRLASLVLIFSCHHRLVSCSIVVNSNAPATCLETSLSIGLDCHLIELDSNAIVKDLETSYSLGLGPNGLLILLTLI